MGEDAERRDSFDDDDDGGREDRRRFLRKAGVAGAAVWVAPVVLSTPAFAAQSGPPPTNPPPCISCNAADFVNPSFESSADGWSVDGSALSLLTYAQAGIAAPPGAGSRPILISGAISQTLPIDPACVDKPFTLTFWSVSQSATHGRLAFFGPNGGGDFDVVPPTSTSPALALRSITGVVPSDATSADFTFEANFGLLDLVDLTICS